MLVLFTLVVLLPPPAYREIQSFCSQEASHSNFITVLLSRGIYVVLIAFVFVSRLNSAVRSARCVSARSSLLIQNVLLDSDRTRNDINGEQEWSADDMCGGEVYIAIQWGWQYSYMWIVLTKFDDKNLKSLDRHT